ncbi:MAG TPA: BTAD domain-containing putative transcriptional regulator [Sporichthyaceae bacterium]|nr:BTAD domain-containing putative transcriptional regulator [Sporichthyaceae bacterium]
MTTSDGRSGRLALDLLGGFRLSGDGVTVPMRTVQQRVVALVALRGPISRSRLAGTLWQEAPEQRALARLRTAIWRVGHLAPAVLSCDAGTMSIHRDVDVDVHSMVEAAHVVLRGDVAGGGQRLLDASGGELLPDWDDEWLADERERLHQMRMHALQVLAEGLADSGQFGLAIDAALSVLHSDPIRETAYRTLMRIHRAEGNLGEVARTYRRCAEVLDRELGVTPTGETSSLLTGTSVQI